jgi:hypothetical protein
VTISSEQNSAGTAASILRRALRADPFYRAIVVDFEDREEALNEALQSYFEFAVEEAARCGDRLYISPRAVAIWRTNPDRDVAEASSERKHQKLLSVLGPSGRNNYKKMVHSLPMQRRQPSAQKLGICRYLGSTPNIKAKDWAGRYYRTDC